MDDADDPGAILHELANWSQRSGVGVFGNDLHRSLTTQSDALGTEIIDFLLQWEEGDDGVRSHYLSSSVDAKQRLQETYEVLDALNHVDKELEDVDGWLAEQVQCLSLIQTRLHVIEKESGTLEKGYQNLKAIQDLSASLVQGLSLSADDERVLLMRPESVLEAAYKLTTLAPDATDTVAPLVTALRNIKKALALKGGDHGGGGGDMGNISPQQWAQVQSLTAVSKQRQKLVELSTFFCGKFVGPLSGLFNAVLQHKSLHDPPHGVKKGPSSSSRSGIVIKHFSFEAAIDGGFKFGTHLTDPTDRALFATRQKMNDGHSARGVDRIPLALRPSKDINEDNVALLAQRAYHTALEPFVPLLALVLQLSPSTVVPLSTAYVTSTADKLYAPMFRVMFHNLRSLVASKGPVVTMASIQRFRHSTGMDFEVPLKFVPPAWLGGGGGGASRGDSSTALNTWTAIGAALLALAPIVKREQTFFMSLFPGLDNSGLTASRPYDEPDAAPKCAAEGLMDVMFSSLISKLQKLCGSVSGGGAASAALAVSSAAAAGTGPSSAGGVHEGVDGMETIAVLVVLQQFMADHLGVSFQAAAAEAVLSQSLLGTSAATAAVTAAAVAAAVAPTKPLMDDYSTYLVCMLLALRRELLLRLKAYTAEQVAWIQAQKSDPKKAGVSVPVAKFPSFVRQVLEMTGGQIVDFAEELLYNLAKQLLQWIEGVAALNEKYADVVRVQNFGFFALAVGPIGVPALEKFVNFAAQQRKDAEARYVLWMVSYSFPLLSALMARMDSVGARVREEELALYVRRKDVVSVVGELDGKQLVDAVGKMYKRLEKHCASADDHDLDLVAALWKKIRDRVVSRLQSLEEAALVSYQLTVPVTSKAVKEIFNRFRRPR